MSSKTRRVPLLRAWSTISGSSGCGCRRGDRTRSQTTAGRCFALSVSTSAESRYAALGGDSTTENGGVQVAQRARSRGQRNAGGRDDQGLLPVLAQAVRSVENDAKRGRLTMTTRATFQAVASLTRQERTRLKADSSLNDARRGEQIKRLE